MTVAAATDSPIGIVVIGRNEGERLHRCFDSIQKYGHSIVYVDSGSSDGSLEHARASGIESVALDRNTPFTAARARNQGFERLRIMDRDVIFVQFLDGDCEMQDGWLERASGYLMAHSEVAVVCGRRRELKPHASIFNQLCDIEWDTPIGETIACGGDSMMRVNAFTEAGGFSESLIAGEEPELCSRLRQLRWLLVRLDEEMSLHDADMHSLGQWWQRTKRGGFAAVEAVFTHKPPERVIYLRAIRPWFWAAFLPVSILVASFLTPLFALMLTLLYPLQIIRVGASSKAGYPANVWYGLFNVIGKFAELFGQIAYFRRQIASNRSELIEYK